MQNNFLAFAIGLTANVLSQEEYAALAAVVSGFQKGLLPSAQINKAIRQSSFVAAALAQTVVDQLGEDALDDGDLAAFQSQLERAITAIAIATTGALIYQGTWNATTNSPSLTSSVGSKGFFYTVSVAGSTDLNGITQWNVGDKAIYNGTAWEKIEGQANEVISVAGRTGAVVLSTSDIAGLTAALAAAVASNRSLPVDDGSANRDLTVADCWVRFIRMTRATANTVSLSLANLATMANGDETSGIQIGAGQTTLVFEAGITVNATPGLKTRAAGSPWTIKRRSATEVDVFGDLAA